MPLIRTSHTKLAVACLLVPLLQTCASGQVDTVPASEATSASQTRPPAGAYEGEVVVAVVERMEHMAHTEWFSDGSIDVSNVLAFGVVAPELFDTLLFVHMKGHPRIGERPLLLGDAVTFVLPKNWRARDMTLEELESLAFRN